MMKTKFAAAIGTIGGLCALCCVVPIAGFLGLGALEAFFCDSPWAKGMGVGLMLIGFGLVGFRMWKKSCANSNGIGTCAVGCGCSVKSRVAKAMVISIGLMGAVSQSNAQHIGHPMPHEMQHGFVLAADDKFASHLVASGHHSRQAEITGQLSVSDQQEMDGYEGQKLLSAGTSYFLFQAQKLDLPSLKAGQILEGHIVESKMGSYEPKNIIVTKATFTIDQVLLNIENPFFGDE